MTAPFPPPVDRAPAALAAVLHEAGPRASVFAELLCGERRRSDAVLADTVHALAAELAHGPVARWNRRFWTLLVASPALRGVDRLPPSVPRPVAALPPALRMVLLLRLVAGLDTAEAAAVLGVPIQRYARALRRALPRAADGALDRVAWQALVAACDARVRDALDARAEHLDRLFAMAAGSGAPAPARGSRRLPLLKLALAACAVAFAATWLVHTDRDRDPFVSVTALPAAASPASTFDGDTALLTDPDFDALADPRDQALATGLDFYAWYAARVATEAGPGTPAVFPDAALSASPTSPATTLPVVPRASR
ncbi:MAG TPA: sigma factor-like helix-turn-helix DNA-binding protein [Luteimonas sp.]|nr:sigma factor-like helix-turn-helix DNA-binding protein [Luteimonas sp.]